MKKIAVILLSLIVLLFIVSCNGSTSSPSESSSSNNSSNNSNNTQKEEIKLLDDCEITPPDSSTWVGISDTQYEIIKKALSYLDKENPNSIFEIDVSYYQNAKYDGKNISGSFKYSMDTSSKIMTINGSVNYAGVNYAFNNCKLYEGMTTVTGNFTVNGSKGEDSDFWCIFQVVQNSLEKTDIFSNKNLIMKTVSSLSSKNSAEIEISGKQIEAFINKIDNSYEVVYIINALVNGKSLYVKYRMTEPENIIIDYFGYDGVFFTKESIIDKFQGFESGSETVPKAPYDNNVPADGNELTDITTEVCNEISSILSSDCFDQKPSVIKTDIYGNATLKIKDDAKLKYFVGMTAIEKPISGTFTIISEAKSTYYLSASQTFNGSITLDGINYTFNNFKYNNDSESGINPISGSITKAGSNLEYSQINETSEKPLCIFLSYDYLEIAVIESINEIRGGMYYSYDINNIQGEYSVHFTKDRSSLIAEVIINFPMIKHDTNTSSLTANYLVTFSAGSSASDLTIEYLGFNNKYYKPESVKNNVEKLDSLFSMFGMNLI